MTVKELIEKLQQYDQNMQVSVTTDYGVDLCTRIDYLKGIDSNGFYFPETVCIQGGEE